MVRNRVDENTQEAGVNAKAAALNAPLGCHVIAPSLEAVLGIGRTASNKPAKVASALSRLANEELPQVLKQAVCSVVLE